MKLLSSFFLAKALGIVVCYVARGILVFLFFYLCSLPTCAQEIIGSKKFLESNILAELVRAQSENIQHKANMGGTIILWEALLKGDIQAYPEYTGTISEVILGSQKALTFKQIQSELKAKGIGITNGLGFSNNYTLVMRSDTASSLNIETISDLNKHNLRVGFSSEFIGRADGWKPLKATYLLNFEKVLGFEHQLAYLALKNKKIDLTDAYSTDPEIQTLNLLSLKDNKNFFPKYEAVYLYRLDSPAEFIQKLKYYEKSISEQDMRQMNLNAQKYKSAEKAAKLFTGKPIFSSEGLLQTIWPHVIEHLWLTGLSLLFAILIGFPLGLFVSTNKKYSQLILSFISVIQTIPSLALLALLIPILGIGIKTAIFALFLYGLLPIVKNTATGLYSIPINLVEQASALGLPKFVQYQKIFIPLAMPTILTGIKTSAILNIGNATLAALIGAGGLGEPILSGLNLNDIPMILSGAIPAACLALFTQAIFALLEKKISFSKINR